MFNKRYSRFLMCMNTMFTIPSFISGIVTDERSDIQV